VVDGVRREYREIWYEYYRRVAFYVRSMVGSRDDLDDIMQEIFIRIFKSLPTYDSRFALSTWIYRIARNYCIDVLRAKRRKPVSIPFDEKEYPAAGENPENILVRKDESRMFQSRVAAALMTLNLRDREIATLFYMEETTVREVARVLSMPEGSVKYRLFRIRHILKDELQEVAHAQG